MSFTEKINIVGAGLAGSLLARYLRTKNIKYNIFDSSEKYAASKFSENIFSFGWANRIGKEMCDNGIKVLEGLVDIETTYFRNVKKIKAYRVKPENVLIEHIKDKVVAVNSDGVETENNGFFNGVTVVCSGFYSKELIPINNLNALTGHGLLFKGTWEKEPMMIMPIPHRHFKAFQFDENRIWFGDSTAVIHKNYIKRKHELIYNSKKRAEEHFGLTEPIETVFGARPFVGKNTREFKLGYVKKINKRVYSLTGGWKMGLVIYPHLINKLVEEMLWVFTGKRKKDTT